MQDRKKRLWLLHQAREQQNSSTQLIETQYLNNSLRQFPREKAEQEG